MAPPPPIKPTPFQAAYGLNVNQDRKDQVYLGPIYTGGTPTGGQQWANKDVVKGQWQFLSPRATQKFLSDAQRYKGWKTTAVPMEALSSVWSEFVDLSYNIQQQTGELVSPLEAYDWWAAKTAQNEARAAGSGGGGGVRVSVSEQVNLTDPTTARDLLENTLAQYLGRRPNEDEYKAFNRALRGAEKESPNVSRTVAGPGGSRTVQKGGLDRQQFTQEYVRGMEGVAETAAATTLLDTFLKTIAE